MRVVLRALTRPLHWVRQIQALKQLIVTQQQQILNQQEQILELQRNATVATHRIEERLGHIESTILKQQQRILELQVEGKAELSELHRNSLLAALHTIEGQRSLEKSVQAHTLAAARAEPIRASVRSAA